MESTKAPIVEVARELQKPLVGAPQVLPGLVRTNAQHDRVVSVEISGADLLRTE